MYNFIFWFFYKYFEWRKGYKSPFLAACTVGLTLLIHFGFIHSIVRLSTGFNVGTFSQRYGTNRLILMPIVIGFFALVYFLFYRRKADEMLGRYTESRISSFKSIALMILILVLPLVAAAILTNLSVKRWVK